MSPTDTPDDARASEPCPRDASRDGAAGAGGATRPGGVDCEGARRLIAAFAHGGLPRKASRVLRGHVAKCDGCRTAYREMLEAVGRLGAARRERAEAPTPEPVRRRARHARIVALSHASQRGARPKFALKAVLLTAAFVFLFGTMAATIRVAPPLHLDRADGGVHLGDKLVSLDGASADVIRGDWVWTDVRSAARLAGGDLVLELGPETVLLLEDSDVPRVLLRRGQVTVDGRCEVTTALGVVRVERGLAAVELDRRRLTVSSHGGAAELFSAVGSRRIGPGDAPLVVE